MKKLLSTVVMASCAVTGTANAATFTPDFSDYAFPGTAFTVDAAANAFFGTNYGIGVENSYLYKDVRDTFDGIGIANGTVAEVGTFQAGRVNFLDLTDFVTIDYLSLLATTYSAFSSGGGLLGTFSTTDGEQSGTFTLSGGGGNYISYVTFSTTGGYGAISNLIYNYDGTTGGGNTDLPPIPEPSTYVLMLLGLGIVCVATRRRNASLAR